MMTFICTDLEQLLRVKTQGTEMSIWYATLCVKGEKKGREGKGREEIYTHIWQKHGLSLEES